MTKVQPAGDPCEALLCPNDATQLMVDAQSKPWRVCEDHAEYLRRATVLGLPRLHARPSDAERLETHGQQRLFER